MKTLKDFLFESDYLTEISHQLAQSAYNKASGAQRNRIKKLYKTIYNGNIDNDAILEFINNNYDISGKLTISDKPNKNGKFEVSCNGDVKVRVLEIDALTNGLFEWSKVEGSFHCSYCPSLKSLEGAPEEVGDRFDCSVCKSLKSLNGAPEKVGGYFDCSYCKSLKSLKGATKDIGGYFICSGCESLKSLKGAPEKVGGDFNCGRCDSLQTLKGAPELEGAPKEVGGNFDCSVCANLYILKGAPEKVGGNFNCSMCTRLEHSLKGAPKEVGGDFDCSNCGVKFLRSSVERYSNVKGEIINFKW